MIISFQFSSQFDLTDLNRQVKDQTSAIVALSESQRCLCLARIKEKKDTIDVIEAIAMQASSFPKSTITEALSIILTLTPHLSTIFIPHQHSAMAILPAVPAFSTTVVVNGEPADEYQPLYIPIPYDAEFEDVPRTRCFIAAETGQTYSIRFRLSPLFYFGDDTDTLVVSIYIDGNLVEESLVFKTLLGEQDFIEHFSYLHRAFPDGSRSSHAFCFQDLEPTECAAAATLQADMQLVKTLGTIRIVLRVAKKLSYHPMHDLSDEAGIVNCLQPSSKALILNGHGQTHGTGFQRVDVPVSFSYYGVDIREAIGCFDFVYLSPDTLEAQGISHPDYINQAAQGMPQVFEPAPEHLRYVVRTMSDGCLEIDLTGDDE
ncbi:hypothetical protein FMUND_14331 [Fusarium mundagurra]|uniref:DUF7918 domain-containing protein n=1 Tax=Fusarium mundagurra TaxID=1567541 RepID=A0A8H5XUZ3_9HYPO|nr:hypothetical protein FMUND_14331 [Fusarium mundagurra]